MLHKRYEVRSRICATGGDIPFDVWKFFLRRNAQNFAMKMNTLKTFQGFRDYAYYVHDTKGDQ